MSILVRWGRHDVAERVLRDPELLEHRHIMFIQPAFQQAMQRASSERNFNVQLIELLLDHGCNLGACDLAAMFSTATEDPFLLLDQMKRRRDFECAPLACLVSRATRSHAVHSPGDRTPHIISRIR